ncbi:NACHT, LRR and PYD domains-containing protein 3-like [Thunnus maccoyii]|uniref:NACHT, LRR and PYD domains-containing protein 3-like n=1 Tax=Thunnus maccoyii TaxID=8240 RepID=UPI001C4CD8A0|nr:NACHT, LRR and PYD domains-containing protein 3-like [Thunnus maccoyii]
MNSCRAGGIIVKLKEELLKTLQDLTEDDFLKFKWFLEQDNILEGFKGIPVAQLEKAERQETVDPMIQKHQGPGALKLTVKVLEKINRNDLVQHLQNFCPEPKGPSTSNTTLNVSEDNREDQLDPDDPERLFREDFRPKVLTEFANISYSSAP